MKRILFVDDEPNILQGLKRMLHSQRREWDMTFTESGAEALDIMQDTAFDAVISDMRMPGMDGAELLERVKQKYPKTVRFILSGHSDQELVMRSVGPSHQYLSKPCEPDTLKQKLSDAFALHELLSTEPIRTLVSGMSSLPSLPNIYVAVVEQVQSKDTSIYDIGKLIEQDPGMATKVLQLVNSAYFGLGRHIASPSEAATFLGLDIIKGLILSQGVFSQFDEKLVKAASLGAIRNRSLQVAAWARKIAKAEGASTIIADQAFIGGLLHDMGGLVMAANEPAKYMRAVELANQQGIEMHEAETQVFNTTHAEVGAYMLGLWGIDDDVVASVAYHHKPLNFPNKQFCALTAVCFASASMSASIASAKNDKIGADCIAYLEAIGLADRIPAWQELCVDVEEDAA